MIKSPLRYPGGKSKAIKFIAPLIPEFNEYREPFVGGGSVYFYLKQCYPYKEFWINDLYNELYLFWFYAQNNLPDLIKIIKEFYYHHRDGKLLYKFLLDNLDNFDDLHKAAAFFIFNRITFSGTTLSGGYSQQAFEKRFTLSSIERVSGLVGLFDKTKITNLDYSSLVNEDGQDVFLFLDPPYYNATKSALYGRQGNLHKFFDHKNFSEIMKKCKHKWLITYDDSEYIRELFSFAEISEWNIKYGMRNAGNQMDMNGKELFIKNY